MFPPSTNDAYQGPLLATWCLTLLAFLAIVPGMIHSFLPDGGAVAIAGLDVGDNGPLIFGVFAWAGATQIVWGTLILVISLRYRSLVPLVLCLLLLERSLLALQMWVLKPTGSGHHPPEAYGTLILVPILAILFAFSLRKRPT
jgi:hypothetical protein